MSVSHCTPSNFNKVSPSPIDVHTIYLIGGTKLNCVLAFTPFDILSLLLFFFMLHDNLTFSFSAASTPTIDIRAYQFVATMYYSEREWGRWLQQISFLVLIIDRKCWMSIKLHTFIEKATTLQILWWLGALRASKLSTWWETYLPSCITSSNSIAGEKDEKGDVYEILVLPKKHILIWTVWTIRIIEDWLPSVVAWV